MTQIQNTLKNSTIFKKSKLFEQTFHHLRHTEDKYVYEKILNSISH